MKKCAVIGFAALMCTAAVPAIADWNSIGSVTFSMQDNHYSARADFHGDRMALTSRLGDVYCRDVEATSGNGRTRVIFSGTLRANDTANVDLPDDVRGVQKLAFDCQPTDGSSQATVDIAANTLNSEQRYG